MDTYTLYIDESDTKDEQDNHFFVMGGIIIKDKDYTKVNEELKKVKKTIWNNEVGCENYILHEMSLKGKNIQKAPPYYGIFRQKSNVTKLYNELSKLIKSQNVVTLAVCMDKSKLNHNYGNDYMNDQLTISIQLIVEHFCQFLIKNNAKGKICYESMQEKQNMKIQQRIYELKAIGTMYFSPATIQKHLLGITFVEKSKNNSGLQLADFVPNTLGRSTAHLPPKNSDFLHHVKQKLYDGKCNEPSKYGYKVLS